MHLPTTSEEAILVRITNPSQVTASKRPHETAPAEEHGEVLHKTRMVCVVGSCRKIPMKDTTMKTSGSQRICEHRKVV